MTISTQAAGQPQTPSGQGGSAPVADAAGQLVADSGMFMTLLMAQIKNQDPLSPTDPAQFVGQLVQMNQMQTSLSMLSELKGNTLMLRELQGLALGGQIGRDAEVALDEVQFTGGRVSGKIPLSGAEGALALVLSGDDGRQVRLELGPQPAGNVPFSIDPAEHGLVGGHYRVTVETASHTPARAAFSASIQGVRLSVAGAEPMLTLAGLGDFPASAITQLSGGKPAQTL